MWASIRRFAFRVTMAGALILVVGCNPEIASQALTPQSTIPQSTTTQSTTTQSANDSTGITTLTGSVGDGPVTQAQIVLSNTEGAIVGNALSDDTSNYTVSIPLTSMYPIIVTATGGTDVVTGAEPGFTMVSAALDSSIQTVNINPFSTLIVKTAQAMPGGLTAGNLSMARQHVTRQLGFGLDPALVRDPITTTIGEANVASLMKASEALGETIRRTHSALLSSGSNLTEDDIVASIAADMTDGVMDGRGSGASSQIAATANIAAAQVLIEALSNHLYVGGGDVTTRLDAAIGFSVSNSTLKTADLIITSNMLRQARIAVAAAVAYSPSSSLLAVENILAGLSGNTLAADIETVLPEGASNVFQDVIIQVPLSTQNQLELINAVVRSGDAGSAPTPAPALMSAPGVIEFAVSAYSVAEDAGVVSITINRIGGSDGEVSVEWKTQGMTATFAQDYGNFDWTQLTFADGETSKTETITINQDSIVEGNETFSVLLQNPSGGASLGNRTSTVVTIVDDDTSGGIATSDRPWEDLVNQVIGFGRSTTGGMGGEICWVNNLNDSGAGSLRNCAESADPKWIRFNISGTIRLNSMITVRSNKTIDGRGQDITVRNYGLRIHRVSNIIIHNIKLEDIGGSLSTNADDMHDQDAIQIRWASSNVWVDHVFTSNIADEHIEVGNASTDITLSWNHLMTSNDGRGFGIICGNASSHTEDVAMRVTMHHNYFDHLIERGPHLRFGMFHIFNNYSSNWAHRAGTAVMNAQLNSEHNIFEAVRSQEAYVTLANQWSPEAGKLRSTGDWLLGGAYFPGGENDRDNVFIASDYYAYTLDVANSALRDNIINNAGWQNVTVP